MCLAQFSIQGPSDGRQRAQGLKFSAEKGLEYTDQSESQEPGGFTIQGATDGSSDFRIQGATDGHSNFQIQGATDGHSNFQIQGPTDGGAATFNVLGANAGQDQSIIQGAGQGNLKALQYNDPSGYRVNWRSYERQARPRTHAAQATAPVRQAAAPARQASHRRAPAPAPQRQQAPEPTPQYKQFDNAPPQIQQLLQYQQQIPYINVIPEHFRFDEQAAIKAQADQVREHFRNLAAQPPAATVITAPPAYSPKISSTRVPAPETAPAPAPERPRHRPRGQSRQKRQANPQQQQQQAEPQPHYSTNLPSQIQALLKFQAQTPYNIFANQVSYRGPDKPYVPQPVSPPQQQQHPQPQQQAGPVLQQAQYQGQGGAYQAQASANTQARVAQYNQGQQLGYNQQQTGYNQQQQGVRPVTENQYWSTGPAVCRYCVMPSVSFGRSESPFRQERGPATNDLINANGSFNLILIWKEREDDRTIVTVKYDKIL
jgi:hypothetical protein